MKKFTFGICAFVLSLSLGWSPRVRADAVTEWNANAAIATCIIGLHESRLYAMMHIAIHDALNTINRRFRPYVLDKHGPSGASAEAAWLPPRTTCLCQSSTNLCQSSTNFLLSRNASMPALPVLK